MKTVFECKKIAESEIQSNYEGHGRFVNYVAVSQTGESIICRRESDAINCDTKFVFLAEYRDGKVTVELWHAY